MNKFVRRALQRLRRAVERTGYVIQKAEAFAFPDQGELLQHQRVRTVFDIGSHSGTVAEEYRKLFPSSTIHCFEAIPQLAENIKRKFSSDTAVKVHPLAIDSAPGRRQFNINTKSDTSSLLRSLRTIPHSYRSIQSSVQTIDVDTTTIDMVCTLHDISTIDVLKMDIQGGELSALQGASNMLGAARIQLIYTEVWFLPFYENQPLFADICCLLAKFDYALHGIYNVSFSGATGRATWADAIFVSPQLKARSYEMLKIKHAP
jgi:FkbM family methyltransferase